MRLFLHLPLQNVKGRIKGSSKQNFLTMRKNKSYEGVLRMCEAAVKMNQKTVNLTCLWKFSEGGDEQSLKNTMCHAKQVIEHYLPGISLQYRRTQTDDIYGELTGALQQSYVEKYLHDQLEKKNKDLPFQQLQKFYNQEPQWLKKTKGFLSYIKALLKKLVGVVGEFTFIINKHKQKIYFQYT